MHFMCKANIVPKNIILGRVAQFSYQIESDKRGGSKDLPGTIVIVPGERSDFYIVADADEDFGIPEEKILSVLKKTDV